MATDEIVVGVDGSEHSVAALQWAVDNASKTGASVVAVNVWEYPFVGDITGSVAMPTGDFMAEGARANAEHVVEKVTVPAGVVVTVETLEGGAAHRLTQRAATSSLLVVGARGRGGFASLLLGSVATQCVNHATVPVVVVPSAIRPT
jgi:nucleotide-binding universal stress UspA family protein